MPAGVTGPYTVTITATNIAGDGVPGNQSALDQDYALVIYNANEVQQPVINGESATLEAEGCNPANGVLDPGETVTYTIALKNVGTAATTNLVATLQATGGVTNPSGAGILRRPRPGRQRTPIPSPSSWIRRWPAAARVTLTLHLTDGATDLGNVTFGPYQTGVDHNHRHPERELRERHHPGPARPTGRRWTPSALPATGSPTSAPAIPPASRPIPARSWSCSILSRPTPATTPGCGTTSPSIGPPTPA